MDSISGEGFRSSSLLCVCYVFALLTPCRRLIDPLFFQFESNHYTCTVNVQRFQRLFSFCSQMKWLSGLELRIANREDPDQIASEASSEAI